MACDLTNVAWTQACEFVKNNSACLENANFIDYLSFTVCAGEVARGFRIFLCVLWMFYLFLALSVSADSFLCSILTRIVAHLGISQNIAGVTFLAFGNGAPDIFSSFAAVGHKKTPNVGLMFGAVLGAGIFVTTIVVGLLPLPEPFKAMERPFLRDLIFYIFSAFYLFVILYHRRITVASAAGFLIIYAVYAAAVIIGRYVRTKVLREPQNGTQDLRVEINADDDEPLLREDGTDFDELVTDDWSNEITPYFDDDDDELLDGDPKTRHNNGRRLLNLASEIGRILWQGLKPFTIKEFADQRVVGKLFLAFKALILVLLKFFIPVGPENSWNQPLTVLQIFCCPIFGLWATDFLFYEIEDVPFSLSAIIIVLGASLAVLTLAFTTGSKTPWFYPLLDYFGFAFTVLWIFVIASEVVNILETIGIVLHVSSATLGLTVLAWANSLGDGISNFSMAYNGYPRIGISACFISPMTNLLLGFGMSLTFHMATTHKSHIDLDFTAVEQMLIFFLLLSLVFSLVWLPLRKFKADRIYSAMLFFVYFVFMIIIMLTSSGNLTGFIK